MPRYQPDLYTKETVPIARRPIPSSRLLDMTTFLLIVNMLFKLHLHEQIPVCKHLFSCTFHLFMFSPSIATEGYVAHMLATDVLLNFSYIPIQVYLLVINLNNYAILKAGFYYLQYKSTIMIMVNK